jgi:acyl transferase domain-containing protein
MSKLALMFPGQGSQAVGMGCDLCAAHPQMRDSYAEASTILDFDLEQVSAMGPAETLARTDVTQPALLANSVGIFRILADAGLRFDAAFGHSLGEYSALVATGALSFADALRLTRRRGQEMLRAAEAEPSGMAAVVGLPDEKVEELTAGGDGLWPPRPGRQGHGRRRQARDPAGRQRRLSFAADGGRPGAAARGARGDRVAHAGPGVLLGLQPRLRDWRLRRVAVPAARLAGALHPVGEETVCGRL